MRNIAVSLIFACASSCVLGPALADDQDRQGIARTRPSDGPTVKTKSGYMTPYSATLPGTKVRYDMTPIPGGVAQVKRNGQAYQVTIEPYWMSTTEVTWGQYQEYMKLYLYFRKFEDRGLRVLTKENEQPARSMTQFAAKQYSKWLSLTSGHFYRLPSEAEWEHACRAGSRTTYSFGNDADHLTQHGWYAGNTDYVTSKVGKKKPNAYGLYDMHGNVSEWVLDAAEKPLPPVAATGQITVEGSIVWPRGDYLRIAKGGSISLNAVACRTSARIVSNPQWDENDPESPNSAHWNSGGDESMTTGFRLIRPLRVPPRPLRETYWGPANAKVHKALNLRQSNGTLPRGLIDRQFPDAVKKLPSGW